MNLNQHLNQQQSVATYLSHSLCVQVSRNQDIVNFINALIFIPLITVAAMIDEEVLICIYFYYNMHIDIQ